MHTCTGTFYLLPKVRVLLKDTFLKDTFLLLYFPAILNSQSGASTFQTLFKYRSDGSGDSVAFGSSASGVKGGKSMKMCLNLDLSRN